MPTFLFILSLMLSILFTSSVAAQELTGHVELETRAFPKEALFEEQHGTNLSLAAEPELFFDWDEGRQRLVVTPFARVDLGDAARTHIDLREGYWQYIARAWQLKIGVAQVFWGVTESQHLVDVINQTDLVENADGEDKLGQPMVAVTAIRRWGTVTLFMLPFFRERTFPGADGRLRPPLIVETDAMPRHERLDLAVRWSRPIRIFDLGVAHFWGTSREPHFAFDARDNRPPVLRPVYEPIHQTSLDAQATYRSWLWKLEALTRSGQGDRFYALAGGFEYTFGNVQNTGADLGLLVEYHYDTRQDVMLGEQRLAATPFDDDFFAGARLALNDVQSTQVLGGTIIDRQTGGAALFVEASRRLGSRWTLDIEARGFLGTDPADPLHSFRRDHYGQIELAYHF